METAKSHQVVATNNASLLHSSCFPEYWSVDLKDPNQFWGCFLPSHVPHQILIFCWRRRSEKHRFLPFRISHRNSGSSQCSCNLPTWSLLSVDKPKLVEDGVLPHSIQISITFSSLLLLLVWTKKACTNQKTNNKQTSQIGHLEIAITFMESSMLPTDSLNF